MPVVARLLQLVQGATVSVQEESSDLLAVGDAANAKLRMLEDRNGVVVQVCSPPGPPPFHIAHAHICSTAERSEASA